MWHGLKFRANKNGLAAGTLLATRETEPADRSPVQPSPGACSDKHYGLYAHRRAPAHAADSVGALRGVRRHPNRRAVPSTVEYPSIGPAARVQRLVTTRDVSHANFGL